MTYVAYKYNVLSEFTAKNIIIRFLKLDFIALGQITQNVQNTLQVFISLIYA